MNEVNVIEIPEYGDASGATVTLNVYGFNSEKMNLYKNRIEISNLTEEDLGTFVLTFELKTNSGPIKKEFVSFKV